jgi:hypothetical protein
VKIHDLGEPSPAEAWLAANTSLERRDLIVPGTEILYFALAGTNGVKCPRS